ncbi:MAG: biopolymer transporter ExbD [Verrucomicrobia bacterium]|nr:MAG: biopolymer transporter ExbD [Verrucomicrobiota bacterium]TAE87498.1 MAG: biopolymer transporter ExbD [Verrucomicrobiota bacterium]TAF25780.1 MAG: biopolymer transporter ExbD [Verrucomicrobiota bacterium]TAF41568.1 MAG: biopolymer transporter ExbD [Verrucomicrobiota bacterium]
MKLESTLPERAGFFFAVPAFNLFALLLVFLMLGPSFVSQSGVAVELPVSRFQMERQADATVLSITAGEPPIYWIEREPVSIDELSDRLDTRRGSDATPATSVLLRVDKGVPADVQRQVAEIALQKGLRVYLLGQPQGTEPATESQ